MGQASHLVGQHIPQAIGGQQQQLVLLVPPQDCDLQIGVMIKYQLQWRMARLMMHSAINSRPWTAKL